MHGAGTATAMLTMVGQGGKKMLDIGERIGTAVEYSVEKTAKGLGKVSHPTPLQTSSHSPLSHWDLSTFSHRARMTIVKES